MFLVFSNLSLILLQIRWTDLDLNGNDISGTGNVNITGIVTATELSLSNTSTANRKAIVGSWTASAGILTSIDTITTSDFKTIEYTLHIENSVGIQTSESISIEIWNYSIFTRICDHV